MHKLWSPFTAVKEAVKGNFAGALEKVSVSDWGKRQRPILTSRLQIERSSTRSFNEQVSPGESAIWGKMAIPKSRSRRHRQLHAMPDVRTQR